MVFTHQNYSISIFMRFWKHKNSHLCFLLIGYWKLKYHHQLHNTARNILNTRNPISTRNGDTRFWNNSLPLSKNAVSAFHFRSHTECLFFFFFCLGKFLKWLADDQSSSITKRSTISNICTYKVFNCLVWKQIEKKFDIKWMYLLCFTFVDTAFLRWGSSDDINLPLDWMALVMTCM